MSKKLLLLSNSSLPDQKYLEFALETIRDFMGDIDEGLFLPFAAVTFSYDEYEQKVNDALKPIGKSIRSIHQIDDPLKAVEEANCIIVGGGNTFRLMERCYFYDLVDKIREKVENGTPYIGWSAGANLAGPTICTSNDMPIICPQTFKSLNLVDYQINPHYTNELPPGHKGETRDQRLEEYIEMNRDVRVLAIPEGSYLKKENGKLTYHGQKTGYQFEFGNPKKAYEDSVEFPLT
jgi:dipeptidase E